MSLNRRRASTHINRRAASNFFNGVAYAEKIGRPLSTFVTINFWHTDCPDEEASERFERLRDNYFCPWLQYKRKRHPRAQIGAPTYAWSIEQDKGHTHVHWMVYLPPRLKKEFNARLEHWVEAVAGQVHVAESAIHVKTADRRPGLAAYLMKGLDKRVASQFRVRPKKQGTVHGKRCGVSRNLGPTARSTH